MNKTVEVIDLYELVEYAANQFRIIVDVELKNAADFSLVPLLIEPSDGSIRVAESAPLLGTFRATFRNVTRSLNLNANMIAIDCDRVEILFDQKPALVAGTGTGLASVGVDSPRLFTLNSTNGGHLATSSSTVLTTMITKTSTTLAHDPKKFEYDVLLRLS